MTNVGPFGPGRVPDLGAMAAEKQMQESGQVQFPIAVIQRLDMMASGISAIAFALQPADAKAHHPTLMPVVDADGQPKGWGVYCVGCSDAAATYISPCQKMSEEELTDWPPPVLIPHPDYVESLPAEASPNVPDFPPED